MTHGDIEQIHHVARLAFLAMSARAVAGDEFETSTEISKVCIVVSRPVDGEQSSVDVEFHGSAGFPMGGLSL